MATSTTLPLVAVVTPVYNGAPHIERTMASVQAQTYPNLVHVVLDNASTDSSPEIIENAKAGPVPIITKRNAELLPQVPNWNAAIGMTPKDAKYVKFLAADDLIRADCIEKMVALAESDQEIDFVHAIDVFNDLPKPHGLNAGQDVYTGKEYGARYLRGDVPWLSATHVFFRVTPERLINPFPMDIRPLMDNDFILSELLNRKMGFVFEPLLFTRYDEGTETAKLGGFRSYHLPGFQLLKRHGEKFLSPEEIKAVTIKHLRSLSRHILFWQMSGDGRSSGSVLMGLHEMGHSPKFTDYLVSILSWPFHKIRKHFTAPKTSGTRIAEDNFVPAIIPYRQ